MELALFVIGALLSVVGAFGLLILNSMNSNLEKATFSVNELNVKVATVIQAIEYHDERIKKLEDSRV